METLNKHSLTEASKQVYVLVPVQIYSQLSGAGRDRYRILEVTQGARIWRRHDHRSSLRLSRDQRNKGWWLSHAAGSKPDGIKNCSIIVSDEMMLTRSNRRVHNADVPARQVIVLPM